MKVMTLKLLPGHKWKGKLQVVAMSGENYVVSFDAEVVNPLCQCRFVYDRATLTPKQLKDWTGYQAKP